MKRLNYLLSKYSDNNVTSDELAELRRLVNNADGEELEEAFYDKWRKATLDTTDNETMDSIFSDIKSCIDSSQHDKRHRMIITAISTAAVILLVLGVARGSGGVGKGTGALLSQNNTITTMEDDSTRIILTDGTQVNLEEQSKLSYGNYNKTSRDLHFEGSASFVVGHKNSRHALRVVTDRIIVTDIGTAFHVTARSDKDAEVRVTSGVVIVTLKSKPSTKIRLKSGERFLLGRDNHYRIEEISVPSVDDMAGLDFDDTNILSVLNKISTRYGKHLKVAGHVPADGRYTGDVDSLTMKQLMDVLSYHFNIDYEIDDTTLYVRFK